MKLEPLTLQDLEKVETFQKKHLKVSIIILLIWGLTILFPYFYVPRESFSQDWSFYLFFIFVIITTFKAFFNFKIEKNKLVGEVKIIGKTDYLDESPVLIFDSPKLKKIIIDEDIYEQFQIGDIVYLEVTHRTREILRIDKVP